MTNLLEFSPTGSETREANVELNELGSDFNEEEENDGSSEENLRVEDGFEKTTEHLVENTYEGGKMLCEKDYLMIRQLILFLLYL